MFQEFRTKPAVVVGALLFLTNVVITLSSAWAQDFEKIPITLKASEVLPNDLLTGPNYRIKEEVKSDGFINIYELETNYGPFTVESTALLLIRINELKAIQKMEQLKKTDVYLDAVEKSGVAPLKTAEGLITKPIETTTGMISGVGRWFDDVGRSISSHDPYQANFLKTVTGQASAKRQFAYEFGVDPYSKFEPLQKALDDISMTAGAGGLTVKAAFAVIPGGAGLAVGFTQTGGSMKSLVRDKSPAELEKINDKKLREMGVSESLAQVFLGNTNYSPQEKTLLVGELASMSGVKDRARFIMSACLAKEESVALFLRLKVQLMALYSSKTKSVDSFVEASRIAFLKAKDGTIVAIFPFDYLAWTPTLARNETAISDALGKMPGFKGKEFWIGGTVDPAARKALEEKGWKVEDRLAEKLLKKAT